VFGESAALKAEARHHRIKTVWEPVEAKTGDLAKAPAGVRAKAEARARAKADGLEKSGIKGISKCSYS